MNLDYCPSLTEYHRFRTREVSIGDLRMGGDNPIRVQSMTTTDTLDTEGTVAQAIRMIDAGCELVRITAPSLNEARNLEVIRKELHAKGYLTPLVADIHFTPNAAEMAARLVEKVRINPGNYADKKKFETHDYTDAAYAAELERIRDRFVPLVRICKEYGTAMRIGTNHGSLSDRILSRYGDTPLGMVESALEFLRIAEDEGFYNMVLSMKASNTQVMVQAYRLLVVKMKELGMAYPLHLGVTEAGDGEDGRIKSAVGIGTLLEDGLGDTVRVSLTEDPEFEIPVAKALVARYSTRPGHAPIPVLEGPERERVALQYNPIQHQRRNTTETLNLGGHNVPRVVADLSHLSTFEPANLFGVDYRYSVPLDKWHLGDLACDYVFTGDAPLPFDIPGTLGVVLNHQAWDQHRHLERHYPLFCADEVLRVPHLHPNMNWVAVDLETLTPSLLERLNAVPGAVLLLDTTHAHGMAEQRRAFFRLLASECKVPVVIKRNYRDLSEDQLQLYAATDLGALLVDGFGDGIWIKAPGCGSPLLVNRIDFGILQAARMRTSKTEYISCPSCGRTLFDLQETTQKIRSRTDHLKGVKIGIMGCIVNGPGEMADADYGYVGVGVGKITLYKGQEVVRRNIPAEDAVDQLIELIREHGDWVERPEAFA